MTTCEYPNCKATAEYDMEVVNEDNCEETFDVNLCLIHYNVTLEYNDDRDPYYWNMLTPQQKRRVRYEANKLYSK